MSATPTPKFTANVNLDDEGEAEEFQNKYENKKGRALADRLGFFGEGSIEAADALFKYAGAKCAAMKARREGRVLLACGFEDLCDSIYKKEIQNKIECW